MKTLLRYLLVLVVITGCATSDNMFVPMDATKRAPTNAANVLLLEQLPDRPYITIGMITPPPDAFDSMAAALNAARREAAEHGADAIVVESSDSSEVRVNRTNIFQSGVQEIVHLRVRCIVWTGKP
jgi:hypothetical protein